MTQTQIPDQMTAVVLDSYSGAEALRVEQRHLGAVMIYYLFYRSKLIPRWLSGWGLVGAVLYLAAPLFAMFGFALELLEMPLAIQEMVLAIWLIVRGFDLTGEYHV